MKPLIFFIHVPKTAGSMVNAILHRELPNGISHCESIIANDAELARAAETVDWMSGHVDLTTAKRRLAATTVRPVKFFTCLREPTAQVMSHYNWLIEIYHRGGEFYARHPDKIKAISEAIRSSRNDTASIIENLQQHAGLFRNCQSRWVLGPDFDVTTGNLHQRLCNYQGIAPDVDGLNSLLRQMVGRAVLVGSRRENVSNYHFDIRTFDAEQMNGFLAKWNSLDEMLRYQSISVCY